ncbi:MAG: hypothetical protein ACP5O7_06080 [Phycisphaerae bacterium]
MAGSGNVPRELSLAFAAGVVGAMVNAGAFWLCQKTDIFALLHCKLSAPFGPPWFYQHVTWGGLFGLLFALPLLRQSPFKRGLLLGLAPTAFALFVVLPFFVHKHMLGLALGYTTPLFVLVFNLIWGVATALWLSMAEQ